MCVLRAHVHAAGDASNAVPHQEVVATVSTTCSDLAQRDDTLSELLPTGSLNVQSGEIVFSSYTAITYDLAIKATTPTSVVFQTNFAYATCDPCAFPLTPNTIVNATHSTCASTVTLAVEDVIYTLATGSIEVSMAAIAATWPAAYCLSCVACRQGTAVQQCSQVARNTPLTT